MRRVLVLLFILLCPIALAAPPASPGGYCFTCSDMFEGGVWVRCDSHSRLAWFSAVSYGWTSCIEHNPPCDPPYLTQCNGPGFCEMGGDLCFYCDDGCALSRADLTGAAILQARADAILVFFSDARYKTPDEISDFMRRVDRAVETRGRLESLDMNDSVWQAEARYTQYRSELTRLTGTEVVFGNYPVLPTGRVQDKLPTINRPHYGYGPPL